MVIKILRHNDMRKFLSLMTIAMLAFFTSCDDLNEMPTFSDSNAFVAFNKAALSVNEDGATLSIPVTLASLKGMTTSVTYVVKDGTAKQGVNFTLADATATLSFDADNRTQNIVINIINNPGVFTGDLNFSIELSSEGTVKPSAESVCTVTIKDKDHPLSKFLGEWTATASSEYFGDVEWTVLIEKDPSDVTVLKINSLVYGFTKYGYVMPNNDTRFYGVVNAEKSQIAIPIGQKCVYQYDGNDIFLYGLTAALDVVETGNIIASISDDGKVLTFDLGAYVTDATGGWDVINPGMTWTKK